MRLDKERGREERSVDRILHSTVMNGLLLVASLLVIPHPNPFRDSLAAKCYFIMQSNWGKEIFLFGLL